MKRKKKSAISAVREGTRRLGLLTAPALRRISPSTWEGPTLWDAENLRRKGCYDEALARLEAADETMPPSERLSAAFGELLTDTCRHDEAAAWWQRLIETSPGTERYWRGYARLLKRLALQDELDLLLERCVNVGGGRKKTALLATQLARELSPNAFDRIADKAAEIVGDDDEGLQKLAILHAEIGNLGLAAECLDRIGETAKKAKKRKKLRQRIRQTAEALEAFDAMPSAMRDLCTPEAPLLALLARRRTAPLHEREGLSMAVTTLGPGGAERQLTNTVNGLRQQDLVQDIRIVRAKSRNDDIDGFYQSQFKGAALPITTVKDEKVDIGLFTSPLGEHVGPLLAELPKSVQRYVGRYLTEFIKSKPKVVHCWSDQRNLTAGTAAVIAGVPRVVLSTRSIAPPGNRPSARHAPTLYRALLACPEVRMINNSRAGAATYEDWLGLTSGTVGVVYNGIDVDQLHQNRDAGKTKAHRESLGLGPETKVVGSLFRFSSEKRPRLWLEAAARLAARDDSVQFVLIGDGVEHAHAQNYSQKLGIADRVHFLGLIKDVVPWYDVLDAVLLTSSREGTSNTALEAQALGKPIITPDVGGMNETMLPGESGLLLEADPSPEAIAEKLAFAIGDEAWLRMAASAGEAFIRERFSIERMSRDTFALYDLEDNLRETA
ncbi:MAG: glycosyltransferase [Geminicoccaceae bacterium]